MAQSCTASLPSHYYVLKILYQTQLHQSVVELRVYSLYTLLWVRFSSALTQSPLRRLVTMHMYAGCSWQCQQGTVEAKDTCLLRLLQMLQRSTLLWAAVFGRAPTVLIKHFCSNGCRLDGRVGVPVPS